MFEQDRSQEERRPRTVFRGSDRPAAGMSRYQVSGTGDTAEIAADRAADQAVGGLFRAPAGGQSAGFGADLSDADLDGGGSPLPDSLIGSMEQSLGGSFSGVRVHTDAGADRASQQINARAFTRGQDIYFKSGSYAPETPEGQHLIAHELAHVAAGDTGIHRANDAAQAASAQPAAASKEEQLRTVSEQVRSQMDPVRKTIADFGNKDSLSDELAGGLANKATMLVRKKAVEKHITNVAEWKKSLDTGMSSYVAASVQAGASEDEAKKKPVYVQAQAVKGSLETLQSELGRTKETIEWGENQFKSAEGGGEGTALPKAVSDMLDDAFCGQFFKAVGDIHKGKGDGGLNDFQTKSQQAADNTASLHGHVAESGADKVARRAGNVSTVTGIVGAGTDTLSAISDFNSEKDELNKHDENFRAASAFFSTATGAVNTVSDAVGTGAEAHALRKQEEARRAKIKAMAAKNPDTGVGKAHASDHAGRADIAGQAAGELGGLVGMGSAIAGGFNSKNDTAGTVNSALGVGASGLGAMSDLFGMSVDSAKAD